MADSEVLKKLKDIPYKIQTASMKGRREVVKEICEVVSTPGISEGAVRFVCRLLPPTLHRYRDNRSQALLKSLLAHLAAEHRDWTLASLTPILLEISHHLKNLAATKSTSQSSLYILRWSTLVIETTLKATEEDGVDYKTVVLTQAHLLAAVTAFGDQRRNNKAYSILHKQWSALSEQKLGKWLEVLVAQPADSGPHLSVMFSALCRHLKHAGAHDTIDKHKSKMLESFTKSLISVKTRPNSMYISGCTELLQLVSGEEATGALLPALHKAMLRSPETVIEAVGEVFARLHVPLDGLALDIGKSLIANVHSRDAWTRAAAGGALGALARRVAGAAPAQALLSHAFAEYAGAGLTNSEDKIAVLDAVGTLSALGAASGEGRGALWAGACGGVRRVLASESHERTLCHALHALHAWLHTQDQVPDDVIDLFKKNISSKTATPAVRCAYTRVLCARASPAQEAVLRPLLQPAVDRAAAQPTQAAVVSEGIAALVGLARVSREPPGALGAVLHHKTLAALPDEVLIQVALLCRISLEKFPSTSADPSSPVYRAFIVTLLAPAPGVRGAAADEARALLAAPARARVAAALLRKLDELLDDGTLAPARDRSPPDDRPADLTGKMILDCVQALCSYTEYSQSELEELCLVSLRACHHPLAARVAPRAWRRLLARLRVDAPQLLRRHAARLTDEYVTRYTHTETMFNALVTLVGVGGGAGAGAGSALGGAALRAGLAALRHAPLAAVTRDEYFTYLTPDGELYDKSVVPGNDDSSEMNMKRESKAYSYKEQQEELQLRRELEEKRRKEGKVKEVQLTAKQKDAIKAQLAKESEIRQRLAELSAVVERAAGLVGGAARGCARALGVGARDAVGALLAAARCPLAAPRLVPLFLALRPALLPAHAALGDELARVTLRLHEPACDLPAAWPAPPLEAAVARLLQRLHHHTVQRRRDNHDQPAPNDHFTGPGFCYVFPLLKKGLCLVDEATTLQGLAVLAHHARLRPASSHDWALQPALFPIDHMFRLLISLISGARGRVQTASAAALLDTAECAARGGVAAADVACLLAGLQDPAAPVRDAALRALLCLRERLPPLYADPEFGLTLGKRLLVATFDQAEDNRAVAAQLWEAAAEARALAERGELVEALLQEIQHPCEAVQRAAAAALAELLRRQPPALEPVLARLQEVYEEHLPLIPARVDSFGHQIEGSVDGWGARRGVALALAALGPQLSAGGVAEVVRFFVRRALADREPRVRADMLDAAMGVVELHGAATVGSLLPVFEEFLDKTPKSGGFDAVRQSVVLLVGSLARHLAPHDARIKPIALRLVAALSTPSQQVQEAVSNCLPHLVTSPALEPEIPAIVNRLMKQLLTAEKYGDRKGAAYGIAGIIKGLGILSLKQLDVMGKLTEAIQDKKNYKYREGALFGFEMLCHKLGRLFEPYVVHVLPHLLTCFGDSSQYVRSAADDSAKLIMSRLSAHGVKLVLPALLHALNDDNWRTKAGSIELLGSMAFCAPKQLSSCLPSIVPKLIEVLSDSHLRVQEAGAEALGVIGSVIRNPEIQAIVPVLLEALRDPSARTSACLQTLLDTKFVHFIDAPSLALIMPVVERAFLDRSTETRKMAAQIIGNMYSLTDQKDLTPYLPNIIPGLKSSLLDPVPEVRSVSARALGAMVKGLGEASFEELLPWLMQTLTSESSSVDRSGAAQGLAEVVAGLGVTKLHKIMPDIIATAERSDIAAHVKDGYIMMFIYMPGCFTEEFTPYIGQIINPILKALADENEYVRDTALRAGQRIVNLYAESAITLLLPELERGLFDENWRIRFSSVQLLGDLLYRISGVSGKMSTETASEDDNFGTEHSHKAIMAALGPERRNRVLAGLYMGRSDVALMVRQAALHVWKVVVTNTPKTLREILPTLFGLLLGCLASTSYDKRQVAARTLGDLVRKLGERVLPEIVPILERGLTSERSDQRQGVCIGLGEILASTSRDAVLSFAEGLVPTVRTALCDPLPEVRQAAAKTFDALHQTVGNKALDDILPPMLDRLRDEDPERADAALDGLKQIMSLKSRAVLPYLVPVLTGAGGALGVDTRALSALAAAAGGALGRHLPRVLPALLAALEAARGTPAHARELEHCRDALLPVSEPPSVRCVVDTLLDAVRAAPPPRRHAAAALLCAYVSHTRADLSPHVPQLLRGLLLLLNEPDTDVLLMAWEALQVFTKALEPEQLIAHVSDVRQAVRYVAADLKGELLPGFCLPKGIAPILPLFRESILNGLPEDKENAALMLGEVIKLTSAAALQPSVVHVTGPLIRILGDRFNASVKAAVLDTLAALLAKVGVMLKQFLPQLQTTFLKALMDQNRAVRLRAGTALAQLVLIHTRADPLFVDVHNGVKTAEEQAIRETCVQALRHVVSAGGHKMSGPLALAILATLSAPALLAHADDTLRGAAAGCLGALLHCLPPPHADAALLHHVLAPAPDDPLLQHGRSTALVVALKETPDALYRDTFHDKIEKALLSYLTNDRIPIVCNGIRGIGYLMRHLLLTDRPVPPALLSQFARSMNHSSNEVKQLMARASSLAAREAAPAGGGADVLRALLPALVNGTKEKNTYVRANSELALRAVLRLPDDEHAQLCGALLEAGAREALTDVVARVLRRGLADTKDEDLDCTLLT